MNLGRRKTKMIVVYTVPVSYNGIIIICFIILNI